MKKHIAEIKRFLSKTIVLSMILAMILPQIQITSYAGEAFTGLTAYKQPDGSGSFFASLFGDENFSYTTNAGGNLLQRDTNGIWHYVIVKDGSLALGNRAESGNAGGVCAGGEFLGDDAGKNSYYELSGKTYSPLSFQTGDIVTLASMSDTGLLKSRQLSQPSSTSLPLVSIVIGFSGEATPGDTTQTPYSNDYDWNDLLFSGSRSIGTCYSTMSGGQFTFSPAKETSCYDKDGNTNTEDKENDGIIHVTIAKKHGDWSGLSDLPSIFDLDTSLTAALDEAGNYIDFSSYDKDEDGKISTNELAISFIVAGYEASYGEGLTPSLWAHNYFLIKNSEDETKDYHTVKGIGISDYIAIGENLENGVPGTTATICHELGHYLGLPDLYNTGISTGDWLGYNVGYASLMASSWGYYKENNKPIYAPQYMDPWSLITLGYYSPETLESGKTYTLNTHDSGNYNILKIPVSDSEYFLLENRQYTGNDKALEIYQDRYGNNTGGIIIWHIDDGIINQYSVYNEVNTLSHRPGVMPVYAEDDGKVYSSAPFMNARRDSLSDTPYQITLYNGTSVPSERTASPIVINRISDNPGLEGEQVVAYLDGIVPVSGIDNVISSAKAGRRYLFPVKAMPKNATNRVIRWSVKDPGDTGAAFSGSIFTAKNPGTAVVTGTVLYGLSGTGNFTEDFTIQVLSEDAAAALDTLAEGNALTSGDSYVYYGNAPVNASDTASDSDAEYSYELTASGSDAEYSYGLSASESDAEYSVTASPADADTAQVNFYDVEKEELYGSEVFRVGVAKALDTFSNIMDWIVDSVTSDDNSNSLTMDLVPGIGDTRTITSSAGKGGSISPSGSVSFRSGDSVSYAITPNAGYKIKSVIVDGTDVGAVGVYAFEKISSDHTITVQFTYTNSGGGGGGGGGGSFSSGSGSAGGPSAIIPGYVVSNGTWSQDANGRWHYSTSDHEYKNEWAAILNPYADTSKGQQAYDWFRFDGDGTMLTGWFSGDDGNTYFLHNVSDQTLGRMYTGWNEIDGKWYCFSDVSDGTRGKLLRDTTTPDGYMVDAAGVWIRQ